MAQLVEIGSSNTVIGKFISYELYSKDENKEERNRELPIFS